MSQDEITVMDGSKCIFFSFEVSDRFCQTNSDIKKHKNYKLLEDYDKRMCLILKNTSEEKAKLR